MRVTVKETRIAEKFQVTVPPDFRNLYGLRIGDHFEWAFHPETGGILLTPKRAQLLNPQTMEWMNERAVARRQAAAGKQVSAILTQAEDSKV